MVISILNQEHIESATHTHTHTHTHRKQSTIEGGHEVWLCGVKPATSPTHWGCWFWEKPHNLPRTQQKASYTLRQSTPLAERPIKVVRITPILWRFVPAYVMTSSTDLRKQLSSLDMENWSPRLPSFAPIKTMLASLNYTLLALLIPNGHVQSNPLRLEGSWLIDIQCGWTLNTFCFLVCRKFLACTCYILILYRLTMMLCSCCRPPSWANTSRTDEWSGRQGSYQVHIKQDFGVLFIKVLQQLEKKNVHIKDFVFFLKDQALVFSSGTEMTDLTDVFDNVVHYCSWYNHHHLETIITAFSLDGEAYKRYCRDFREYCRHRICRLNLRSKNAFGSGDEHREPVMIKIDKHRDVIMT